MLFLIIVAVKVVASSASIIVYYTHVPVVSENTSETSLGHEYKNCQLALFYMKLVQ